MPKSIETSRSPRIWQPARQLAGRLTVDSELAIPVLRARKSNQILGEKINDLSPLGFERHLRRVLLDGARLFVQQMARKRERYSLITNEGDLRIWGPVQFVDRSRPSVVFARDEWSHPEAVDFKIVGDFLAEFGYVIEHYNDEGDAELSRITQTAAVAQWNEIEDAALEAVRSGS